MGEEPQFANHPMMAEMWRQAMASGQNPVELLPTLLGAHHTPSPTDSDKITELYEQMNRTFPTEREEEYRENHGEEHGEDEKDEEEVPGPDFKVRFLFFQ